MSAGLFRDGEFTSHAGMRLPYKIDCDALTDDDIATIAGALAHRVGEFASGCVHGIPHGGLRLADAMREHATPGALGDLIVDDVLTTGTSMMEKWRELKDTSWGIQGVVIFARGPIPAWVTPLFIESGLEETRTT